MRPDSIVYTDSFGVHDVLDASEFHHVQINHSELFADDMNHINGIENFWNQTKGHLRAITAFHSRTFTCSSRSVNDASITALLPTSSKFCNTGGSSNRGRAIYVSPLCNA